MFFPMLCITLSCGIVISDSFAIPCNAGACHILYYVCIFLLLWMVFAAEFFGKVKDKAGEMEKKMKDKDKHGKKHVQYMFCDVLDMLL